MKKIIKKSMLASIACLSLTASLFADASVCDSSKIEEMFQPSKQQGVNILKTEPSLDIAGACDVFLDFNGKIDLIYAFVDKNEFIAGGNAIVFNPQTKQYSPKNIQRINSIMQEQEEKLYVKAMDLLKDNKKLNEYFSLAKVEYSKDEKKAFDNKKYEFLLFESLECHFCKDFNEVLKQNFADKNLKMYRYYLPLTQDDYSNLKDNYYKNEDALKKAIELKNALGLNGVPMVVVRDAKTKKIIELFRSPNAPTNFEKVKKYLQ